jgi:hypothetical protein
MAAIDYISAVHMDKFVTSLTFSVREKCYKIKNIGWVASTE